jgi:hypothetical protein
VRAAFLRRTAYKATIKEPEDSVPKMDMGGRNQMEVAEVGWRRFERMKF